MITLTITIEEVDLILVGLRKLPMEIAEPLFHKIRNQTIPQVSPSVAPPVAEEPQILETLENKID